VSILDKLNPVEIEPGEDPCRIWGRDMNTIGAVCYCACEYDEYGDVSRDCSQCSDGLICLDCDDRFKGLDVSISVFY
jgi:hypothetical protein